MTNNKPIHLFFDTETSGFIKKDLDHNHPDQQWCCQIGAILSTEDEILDQMDVLIKANGRKIPKFLTDNVHGISVEDCDEKGITEVEAIEQFTGMIESVKPEMVKYVCHNFDFDYTYLDHLFLRNMNQLSDVARSKYFIQFPHFCTMKDKNIVKFCGLKNKAGRPKWPKLEELHQILFNKDFDNAHNAFADVQATRSCYYELIKKEIINE